jgi:hypothetical protein
MTKAAELAKMGEVLTNSQIGGRRNIVINGAMQVAQRGTSATGVGSGTVGYVAVDRFRLQKDGSPTARFTVSQDTNAPVGFANSMKVAVTTADTSVGSAILQYVDQFIEAQNLQQLAYGTSSAKKITLSFYVKCSTAQTFAVDLVNEDNTKYFNTTYTVSSADTWERKTITIPADTASGFNNDNGRGLRVRWTLVAGSNWTDGSVSTAWSGDYNVATNHQNTWVGATSRAWQLTGVQLEVGSQATPFEHRSFGEELGLCQRYYTREEAGTGGVYKRLAAGICGTTTAADFMVNLSTPLRATPTLETSGNVNHYLMYSANATDVVTALVLTNDSDDGTYNHSVTINGTVGSGLVAGDSVQLITNNNASYYLAFDAEL